MFRRLHDRLGTAGLIIAVIALVAALAGSAFAASALTGKQKKEVQKIAKQFAGKEGPQGLVGQTGAQGSKGDAGAAGADGKEGPEGKEGPKGSEGKPGKNGEGVTIIPLPKGNEDCEEGGTKFTNLSGTGFACNGTGGTNSGGAMSGYWEVLGESGFNFGPSEWSITTISFPAPLESAPEVVLIPPGGGTEEEQAKCPGGTEEPEATPGVLCLYPVTSVTFEFGLPKVFGAVLAFSKTSEAYGSWAVE